MKKRVKDSFWEPRVFYTVTLPYFFHCNLFCNFLVQLNFKVLEFFSMLFFFNFLRRRQYMEETKFAYRRNIVTLMSAMGTLYVHGLYTI